MSHLSTIISIHWEENLPDHPMIHISGDVMPHGIVLKVIDKMADHNTPVDNSAVQELI